MLYALPAVLRALAGAVEGAVAGRATTAELWQAMRVAAIEQGRELTGVTIQDVNRLRSTIAGLRNASESLRAALEVSERTGLEQSVSGEMLGRAWWGRDITQQLLAPQYRTRVELLVENPDYVAGIPGVPETLSKWVTLRTGAPPTTTAELRAWVSEAVGSATEKYDYRVAGTGAVQVLTT
jgi:hypothetical protein